MSKLNNRSHNNTFQILILWILVLVSAVSVVFVNHLCRQKYSELSDLESSASTLETNYGRLILEFSAWGSMHRVELLASKNHQMVIPKHNDIVIIDSNREGSY